MKFKIKILFAWYDLWIGIYIDVKNQVVYILPIPMLGLRISWVKK